MPKLIQDTLHPAGHLIPCMALCCCIASCYLGGDIKCCKCDKVEKPETEKAKLTGPSVDIKCCHCPSPPTCCKSPSCYQFECCDFSQADCFRISIACFTSCCCLEYRCALPRTDEVPCLLTFACITCYFENQRTCKVCSTLSGIGYVAHVPESHDPLIAAENSKADASASHNSTSHKGTDIPTRTEGLH